MGEITLIIGLLIAGISVFLLAYNLLAVDNNKISLSWAAEDAPAQSSSKFLEGSRPLVHKFSLPFAVKLKLPGYRERVAKKIALSGLEQEINVDEFIGLQILWGLLFPGLLLFLNFTLELEYPLLLVILMGFFGFYFPHMHANAKRKARTTSVLADLPFFIDLLALSVEAGLDFIGAIQRVVEKAEDSELAKELGIVLKDLKLGSSRMDALRKFSDRLDMSEVTSFVTVLIDADSTGASIGKVLKNQSVQMRLERFVRAEKAGARASQLILVPLMIFILPAVFIMVFGPVVLQFMGQGAP